MEKTFLMIKPDCVLKNMIGTVILGIESMGLQISRLEMKTLSRKEACALYVEHKGKWHFERNIKHVTSGPCVIMQINGKDAVRRCRDFVERFRNSHKDVIELPRNLLHATSDESKVSIELVAMGLDNSKSMP